MGAVLARTRAGNQRLATEPLAGSRPAGESPRPEVRGKFLFVGDTTFHVRGVTYGAFRPDEHDQEYRNLEAIDADFAQMAANGINAVRSPTPCRRARCSISPRSMVCASWSVSRPSSTSAS